VRVDMELERQKPPGGRRILTMLMDLFFALLIGFLAAESFALIRWKGWWRLAALLPLFVVGFILVRIAVDPTQHYLLAFEVLIWSFLALVFLGLLAGIRWMVEFRHRRRAG
jgi:hypothetical protein